jgi:hypothetical protein
VAHDVQTQGALARDEYGLVFVYKSNNEPLVT